MKSSSKTALYVAAGAAAVFALLRKGKEKISGISGTRDEYVIAKVISTRYRNTSYYGNPSYYVTLETKDGQVWHCYTAPNASIGYEIENGEYKREWHKYMYRDGARGCALHWVR